MRRKFSLLIDEQVKEFPYVVIEISSKNPKGKIVCKGRCNEIHKICDLAFILALRGTIQVEIDPISNSELSARLSKIDIPCEVKTLAGFSYISFIVQNALKDKL